jgi:eukaryotic-like serine/threonine-protein kinase
MRTKKGTAIILTLFCVISILSLSACGGTTVTGTKPVSGQTVTAQSGNGSPASNGGNNGTQQTTKPVPATTTDCPASGTARAMVTAPLALGSDPTIVYAINSPDGTTSPTTILKRFDAKNGQKTVILTLQNTFIQNEQLSADGQWVLFTATTTGSPDRLEMIRLDGQGQQTLYCGAASFVQWSPDQKYLAFDQTTGSYQNIELLTLATGTLQTELHNATTSIASSIHVQTWLNNTHLYLFGLSVNGHRDSIFLLDTSKGANQNIQSVLTLSQNQFIDFDSSFDGQHLYIASSDCETAGCLPPGTITTQSATTPSAAQKLLNDPKHAIMTIRAVTASTLFFVLSNSANPSLDNTQNGLWKMNANGTGLTRLTSDAGYANVRLNEQSQYTWSNLSRDNSFFVAEEDTQGGATGIVKSALIYGSIYNGNVQTFAQGDETQALSIVGWATM